MSRRACPLHVPLAPVAAAAACLGEENAALSLAGAAPGPSVAQGGGGDGGCVGGSFADRGAGGGDDGGVGLDEPGEEFWASADYCGFLRYSYEPGTMRRHARARACRRARASGRLCFMYFLNANAPTIGSSVLYALLHVASRFARSAASILELRARVRA